MHRFANEVSSVTAPALVEAEVAPVAGMDQQVVSSMATEPVHVAGEDVMTTAADVVKDERPAEEPRETADTSPATRNQCKSLLCGVI